VFNASFAMYAPMPYILEECLYKIYEDKGWNIVTSINTRGNSESAYPTLSDLYNKIDDVVDHIGYHDRIAMDIKAALKTRINNLCIGGKGLMLNTSTSIKFDEIIASPVVFELKALGNDEEKAFMMGLILMAIWEYYESSRAEHSIGSDKLKHMLVMEEAHRLLKNVPVEKASEEQSNIKGKGIETFCNLLAEIRAYGEGVVVSEQIPVKLAPDVIKNSNLKIMHRLTSKEDRDFMGDTMELNRHQKREAARLGTGEAIFYREGLDRPVKIQVPISTLKKDILMISDQSIQKRMLDCFYKQNPKLLMRFVSCQRCKYVKTDMCEKNLKKVKAFSSTHQWKDIIIKTFIPYIIHPDKVSDMKYLTSLFSLNDTHLYCLISHLIKKYIDARSNYYQWTFEFTGKLTVEAHNAISNSQFLNIIGRSFYQQSANATYRFPVCKEFCKNKALFCYEGSVLLRDPETHNNLVHLLNSQNNNETFYQQLKQLIIDFVKSYSSPEQHHAVNSLAICYLIQKLNEHQFSLILQKEIMSAFVKVLD
ncbi:MAG: ATP-binding protein, partial [Desulfamplus sp.]|nr:ATP-binding protein [Desulfamplus sp.]